MAQVGEKQWEKMEGGEYSPCFERKGRQGSWVLRLIPVVGIFPVLIACGVRHSKISAGLYIKALRI